MTVTLRPSSGSNPSAPNSDTVVSKGRTRCAAASAAPYESKGDVRSVRPFGRSVEQPASSGNKTAAATSAFLMSKRSPRFLGGASPHAQQAVHGADPHQPGQQRHQAHQAPQADHAGQGEGQQDQAGGDA